MVRRGRGDCKAEGSLFAGVFAYDLDMLALSDSHFPVVRQVGEDTYDLSVNLFGVHDCYLVP